MQLLFSYGTLQYDSVQLSLYQRILQGQKDALRGYVVKDMQIKDADVIRKSGTDMHPILIATGNEDDIVQGTVFQLTEAELKLTDDYEVSEYRRVEATLISGVTAWIYVGDMIG